MAATPQGLSEETYDLPMQADDIESAPAELERSALEGLDSGVPVSWTLKRGRTSASNFTDQRIKPPDLWRSILAAGIQRGITALETPADHSKPRGSRSLSCSRPDDRGKIATLSPTGTLCETRSLRLQELRRLPLKLPFRNWLILYRVSEEGILILRCLHSAQDWHRLYAK